MSAAWSMRQAVLCLLLITSATSAKAEEYLFSAGPITKFGPIGGVSDRGRSTLTMRVQWAKRLTDRLEYIAAMVPVEMQFGQPGNRDAYGAGVDVLGLRVRSGRVYVSGHGGLRMFNVPVPIREARRFNFVGELGVGIALNGGPTLGIAFHHVSNGNTAARNPGANYLLVVVGGSR